MKDCGFVLADVMKFELMFERPIMCEVLTTM